MCYAGETSSFKKTTQGNQQWQRIRDNLYINAQHQLALKLPYANRCSMFLSDNIQVDQSLSISNNRFYIHLSFGEESEHSLTEILDAVTFQQLHPTNLYKDKEHV